MVCDTYLSQITRHFKAHRMSRLTPTHELDRLVELIGIAPDGVGIDTIAQQLGIPIHRRTLQRRLALLVAQQRIEMLGDRRTAGAVAECGGGSERPIAARWCQCPRRQVRCQ